MMTHGEIVLELKRTQSAFDRRMRRQERHVMRLTKIVNRMSAVQNDRDKRHALLDEQVDKLSDWQDDIDRLTGEILAKLETTAND